MSKIKELIVAAIDFGTTYSGYAYSFKADPSQVYANAGWSDGEALITPKTPTVVLFNKEKKFHSFGYEAENKYTDLANEEEHEGWCYFRRFKMALANKKIHRDMKLEDDEGKKMRALDVFSAAIEYLKDHAIGMIRNRFPDLKYKEDIRWVLTVPAIWDNAAKQFMTLAATNAGILHDKLVLAYEPEAAAVFCKELEMETNKKEGKQAQLQIFQPGSQFMVLDLGGGTMDITALEVKRGGTLGSLSEPSGGPWGGILVDQYFHSFMEKLFGSEVYDEWSNADKAARLDLDRALEVKKRSIKETKDKDTSDIVRIKVSESIFKKFQEIRKEKFVDTLEIGEFAGEVEKKRDKLNVNKRICIEMFQKSKDKLISHVASILKKPELRQVRTLIMVGGFSESHIINEAIKAAFPRCKLILPPEASIAIVKGAVLYGHNTDSISSRIMPFSYGISTARPFDEKRDPMVKKTVGANGIAKCEDVFECFVQQGDTVVPNKTTYKRAFNAPSTRLGEACVEIYRSNSTDTRYVTDEGCVKEAELKFQLDSAMSFHEKALVEVEMSFGDTEITVSANEAGARRKPWKAVIDFLR